MRKQFVNRRPETLNEKILYKMAFDRTEVQTEIADKVAARDYVADRVGRGILSEVYQILDSPNQLRLDELPERFVIKPTHGSGAVIIVDDRAPVDAELLTPAHRSEWRSGMSRVQKAAINSAEFEALALSWLRNRYGIVHEWAYRDIPPRLIVEELLEDLDGGVPPDYKFWCFAGQVGFIQVDLARFSEHTRSLHLPDWQQIDATILYPAPDQPPPAPRRLDEMLDIATELAGELDFVRVDLYSTSVRVVFGELTNYPGAGGEAMHPEVVLAELGAAWRPERHYGPGFDAVQRGKVGSRRATISLPLG